MSVKGQSCDCPVSTSCGTCTGGLVSVTLRFNGSTPEAITAADQTSTVFSQVVNPNSTFSFTGSIQNDKFVGPNISMTVDGSPNATIPSNCGSVFVGNVYGSFTIVAAESKNGGALCCSTPTETTPPQITGCSDIIVSLPASACSIAGGWTVPTATDNCTVVSFTGTKDPTDLFNPGVTTVTYTAVDKYNNSSNCSFTVTVVDDNSPVFAGCPGDITVEAQALCQFSVSWTPPTATDNCSATVSADYAPGSVFDIGTTIVTYTAVDPAGNTATCSFNVIVRDTTDPVISGCPGDITVEAQALCQSSVSWTAPTATDNCSATVSTSHEPGDVFDIGTTIVTYTAVDPAGNTTTCSFNVTVRDTTKPVINGCPGDITIMTTECEGTASWLPPTASDSCDASLEASHEPGVIFPLGITVITYTASDNAGNTIKCSFKVTVKTEEAPAITGCPDNITLHTFGETALAEWTVPQATPVCGNLSESISHQPGTQFGIGTTEVVYEFKDGTGNTSTCSFNVTVIKDEIIVDVSKVVTPNGDGINDTWLLTNIEKFKDNTVLVVDRWGNRIYYVSGYDNVDVQWNGVGPGGSKVPVGTYFYTVEVRVNNTMVKNSGFIEILY